MGMELTAIREAMTGFAGGFDASRITTERAAQIVKEAAAIKAAAAAVEAQAAARAAKSEAWRKKGAPSPAHALANETGVSLGQAIDMLKTGQRLTEQPELAAAAATGELSAQQTSLIAAAAESAPEQTGTLINLAKTRPLPELKDECARVRAAADQDPEATRKRIHDNRSLRSWTDKDGTGHLHVKDNPEVIAGLTANLHPVREELFQQARKAGQVVPSEALDADALVETVRRGALGKTAGADGQPGKSPAKILVHVDWDTLMRGYPIQGERCEVIGVGPVAVSAVREMSAAGGFLAAVVTKGEQVAGVAHLGRRPTAAQETALEWLYPRCANTDCHRARRLDKNHQHRWADTKITLLDWLDHLCDHDHDLHTHHGWRLVDGTGRRAFVPPEDPRHPDHAEARPPPQHATG